MTGPFEVLAKDDPDSTSGPETSRCPGCGLVWPAHDGPTHPYIGASPACWALYGRLIAREFNDAAYLAVHQMSTDTYAVQHPGVPERRSIQSVAIHLMTLCLVLEGVADPMGGSRLHQRMVERPAFHWLEPPQPNGNITIADVLPAEDPVEHHRLVTAWAQDVWTAWAPHHATVRAWIEHTLG
jgi:hypothetical protein